MHVEGRLSRQWSLNSDITVFHVTRNFGSVYKTAAKPETLRNNHITTF